MKVGIKYCGGCNPRYDRPALVRELMENYPEHTFMGAQPHAEYDVLLMVCGCPARCAGLDGMKGGTVVYLADIQDRVKVEDTFALLQRR